jgi:S1-C subfamily serine protease
MRSFLLSICALALLALPALAQAPIVGPAAVTVAVGESVTVDYVVPAPLNTTGSGTVGTVPFELGKLPDISGKVSVKVTGKTAGTGYFVLHAGSAVLVAVTVTAAPPAADATPIGPIPPPASVQPWPAAAPKKAPPPAPMPATSPPPVSPSATRTDYGDLNERIRKAREETEAELRRAKSGEISFVVPATSATQTSPTSFRTPALVVDPSASEVKIVRQMGNRLAEGSGTVIDSRKGQSLVLTNHHVTPDPGGKISVEHGGYSYPANWVASDRDADLAVLLIGYELPAVALADELPAKGAELRQWGHPGGGPAKPKKGVLLGLDAPTDPRSAITASYEGVPGESGCGVFNAEGKLVAVLNSFDGRTHRASCIPIGRVKTFVADYMGKSFRVSPESQTMPASKPAGPVAADYQAPLECTT